MSDAALTEAQRESLIGDITALSLKFMSRSEEREICRRAVAALARPAAIVEPAANPPSSQSAEPSEQVLREALAENRRLRRMPDYLRDTLDQIEAKRTLRAVTRAADLRAALAASPVAAQAPAEDTAAGDSTPPRGTGWVGPTLSGGGLGTDLANPGDRKL